MKIYNNLSSIKKLKKSVIAVGNFDGIHLGHKQVLKEAYNKAKKNRLIFGVITFEPVPVMFFNKTIRNHRINNLGQKISGLKDLKVDFLVIIKFNKKFSNLNYLNFIKKILIKKINSKFIFVSKNFKFGKNRKGNIKKLLQYEDRFSYKTCVSKPLKKKNKVLSSSIIRSEINKGNIEQANKFLGREWSIIGKIIKGKQRGRKIGFPTCNIRLQDYVLPKLGVYSVKVHVNQIIKKGVANIGYRPTFKGKSLLLEVNIFGLNTNLYNKKIKVKFIKFIRSERKFKNISRLKVQIKKDIIKAKN
jgi:riboflavin kinase / FMN adenylyltransferase|tara:strand:+ start:112 stop:1020 length:909 start_codon:yes stop_codon:yes gene_type:complete